MNICGLGRTLRYCFCWLWVGLRATWTIHQNFIVCVVWKTDSCSWRHWHIIWLQANIYIRFCIFRIVISKCDARYISDCILCDWSLLATLQKQWPQKCFCKFCREKTKKNKLEYFTFFPKRDHPISIMHSAVQCSRYRARHVYSHLLQQSTLVCRWEYVVDLKHP